jgi:hypothetical protein
VSNGQAHNSPGQACCRPAPFEQSVEEFTIAAAQADVAILSRSASVKEAHTDDDEAAHAFLSSGLDLTATTLSQRSARGLRTKFKQHAIATMLHLDLSIDCL